MSHIDAEPQNDRPEGLDSTGKGAPRAASTRKSSPLLKPVPTPRISFAKQLALLRAYASLNDQTGKPVQNADAATVVDMAAGTVSLANAFFAEVGFLVKSDGGYTPSEPVTNFHRQWQWKEETAGRELYPLLANSWFGRVLLPKLTVSGTMSEQEALAEMSKAANATPDYKSQLETLLEYLTEGGVVTRENGVIRPIRRHTGEQDESVKEKKIEPPRVDPPTPPVQTYHPFVEGLLQELPKVGSTWDAEDQKKWLAGWAVALGFLYKSGSTNIVEPPVRSDQEVESH